VSDLLLQTKLFKPALRPSLITRPHLINRLNAGLSNGRQGFAARLTLVCAPAGFGKTTLIADWGLRTAELDLQPQLCWLSLDENDNDPIRFLAYLIAALQTAVPGIGETAVRFLQSPQPPAANTILTPLINDISRCEQAIILVLDDYHVITIPPVHQILTFLLDHLPPLFHLLITTRSDPPLPLSRLRARRQMVEIRAGDLRFTLDEASAFLNEAMGLKLSAEDVAALETRTEGWIAGLQLAALSIQGRKDMSGFVRAFAGSNRFVLDYLVEEVLNRRPKGTLNFLLQTAVLDRLNGPLCDQVTGQTGGQAMLEELERSNLFLVALDDERKWYRYHHLFADVLLNRLLQSQPDTLPGLHLRASEWYELNGLPFEAVSHALAAQAFDRAALLIEKIAPAMIQRSELAGLLTWLDALPDSEVQARPMLALYFCWGLFLSGKMEQAVTRLEAVASSLPVNEVGEHPEIQGHIAAIRAYLVRETGDFDATITLSRQALRYLGDQDVLLRAMVTFNLALACYLDGDFESAAPLMTEIVNKGQSDQLVANTLSTIYTYTQLLRAQGGLEKAMQLCHEGLALVEQRGWHNFPAVGFLHVALGDLLRERNELSAAAKYLTSGIKLGQEGAHPHIIIVGNIFLSWLRQAEDDSVGSYQAIQSAVQLIEQWQISRFWPIPPAAAYRTRIWIAQGELVAAEEWASATGLNAEDASFTYLNEVDLITLARLRIAQGDLETAVSLLHHLQEAAAAAGRNGSLIEILILQAITFTAQQHSEKSLQALEQALTLAEPQGYMRVFLDEGEPLRLLLLAYREQLPGSVEAKTRLFAYINRLLAAFSLPGSPQPPQLDPLLDPLSDRELEVLRLVAAGASNRDIAQTLFVAIPTVKKHVSNIMSKLNASSRTQAVAEARTLGLL